MAKQAILTHVPFGQNLLLKATRGITFFCVFYFQKIGVDNVIQRGHRKMRDQKKLTSIIRRRVGIDNATPW